MEGTTFEGTLHHHHASGEPNLQPVASSKVTGLNRGARWQLTHQQPPSRHLSLQLLVVPWVHPLQGRAQNRHRLPPLGQATPVHRPVNPFRQTTHHGPAGLGQGRPNRLRHCQPMQGGAPGANHRDGLTAAQQGPQPTFAAPVKTQGRPLQRQQLGGEGRIGGQQHPPPALELSSHLWQGIWPPMGPIPLQLPAAQRSHTRQASKGFCRRGPGRPPATEVVPNSHQAAGANPGASRPKQPPEPLLQTPASGIGGPQQGTTLLGW